ncbi:MAG: hypothetical protein OHK0011_08360 [Turneriella sp.]
MPTAGKAGPDEYGRCRLYGNGQAYTECKDTRCVRLSYRGTIGAAVEGVGLQSPIQVLQLSTDCTIRAQSFAANG